MLIIPAIDIKDGQCVRLFQGNAEKVTVFDENPLLMARKWRDIGAGLLHVVDLNGAFNGIPVNSEIIKNIISDIDIPVQLGGGIRDMETIENYLALGINRVILGTIAVKDPKFVLQAAKRFPGRIMVGIDAVKGMVAIKGWTEITDITAIEMALEMEAKGAAGIIYTDIERDGAETGPNIGATRDIADAVNIPVIASGGVSGLKDIKNILPLEKHGVSGVITGRAIYTGSLDLKQALDFVSNFHDNPLP